MIPNHISIDKITLWNFGVVGNSELHLLKISEMGSSKPSGSALAIYDTIKLMNPDYVIMVGIAFGLKFGKQNGIASIPRPPSLSLLLPMLIIFSLYIHMAVREDAAE